MTQDIYDPLNEYVSVFRDRFNEVAKETFAQLADEAKVDVEANRETCRQLYAAEESLSSAKSSIGGWNTLLVCLWLVIIGSVIYIIATNEDISATGLLVSLGASIAAALLLWLLVYPKLQELKGEKEELEVTVRGLRQEAWQQMEPLNRLYDWDVLTRMMTKTVPRLEFDPYFTTQRLADLQQVYGWDGSFNKRRSVIYSHSGLINGNPFVICRTRRMRMGKKTYQGSKTISWTRKERGADGKYHYVRHTQTLVAYVQADYPEYPEKTRLIYGNTSAPDLIFNREHSGLASKVGSLSYKMKLKSLRNKARDLEKSDYAMMTNEEFEVVFDTSNRNNNQQFALLFTPLAQESMTNLLKDDVSGYGDDFDFEKLRMINTITPEHMQEIDLDMNPDRYRSYDYDKAQDGFQRENAKLFRAIYFSLAPLLCVPLYQQIRPRSEIYGIDMAPHSSFWEHEALANFWGDRHFKAENCVTKCILKTEQGNEDNDSSTITVHAYGYRTRRRLTYVKKLGGDGKVHNVPVYWDEYIPVSGSGMMRIREDNTGATETAATQTQRMTHINGFLSQEHLSLYRRHIASGV